MKSGLKKGISFIACLVLTFAMVFAAPLETYAWSTGFSRIATKSIVNKDGYAGLQGLAFDTYTGKDGYSFTEANNGKKMALIHFTMSSSGKCKKKKTVIYKTANVGHANDATIFRDAAGKKWILFTLYGKTGDKYSVKASNGKKIELGAISIDEFNKGKAIVHECKVSGVLDGKLKGKITGITYIGDDKFQDESAAMVISGPCFVLNGGDKYVRAYLDTNNDDVSSGTLTLTAVGIRARIVKPKLSNGKEAKYQGIAYHKGYIYILADGNTSMPTSILLCRIKMKDLFNGTDSYQKKTDVFRKKITKQGKTKLIKNAPESVFFTNLEGKSRLYLSVNRKNKKKSADSDAIIRSSKTY